MKTAVIWNEINYIRYTILDGDFRKFHDVYINSVDSDEQLMNELNSEFYTESGEYKKNLFQLKILQKKLGMVHF